MKNNNFLNQQKLKKKNINKYSKQCNKKNFGRILYFNKNVY